MHVIILVKPISEIKEAYLQVNKFYKKKTRKLIQMRVLKPNSRKKNNEIYAFSMNILKYSYNQNCRRLEMYTFLRKESFLVFDLPNLINCS